MGIALPWFWTRTIHEHSWNDNQPARRDIRLTASSGRVMAGLDPAIHDFCAATLRVDARVKPGHDGGRRRGNGRRGDSAYAFSMFQ
jgi:hypothetical protein